MRSCLPAFVCNNKWYGVNPRSGSLASLLFARTNITRHTHATFKTALHCKPRGKAAQYEVIWLWNPGHATKIHHTVRRSCLHLWVTGAQRITACAKNTPVESSSKWYEVIWTWNPGHASDFSSDAGIFLCFAKVPMEKYKYTNTSSQIQKRKPRCTNANQCLYCQIHLWAAVDCGLCRFWSSSWF